MKKLFILSFAMALASQAEAITDTAKQDLEKMFQETLPHVYSYNQQFKKQSNNESKIVACKENNNRASITRPKIAIDPLQKAHNLIFPSNENNNSSECINNASNFLVNCTKNECGAFLMAASSQYYEHIQNDSEKINELYNNFKKNITYLEKNHGQKQVNNKWFSFGTPLVLGAGITLLAQYSKNYITSWFSR